MQIPEYPGDHFHYVFSKILMAGRANGLQVIDGPFLKIRELDGFRDYSMRCRILGYDGKWALHPDQVTVLNEVFTPTQEQFDRAFDILEAYEKATTEGDRKGAVMFGDEMIDEASRKMAIKFVTRGERAGMHRSPSSPPKIGPAPRRRRRYPDAREQPGVDADDEPHGALTRTHASNPATAQGFAGRRPAECLLAGGGSRRTPMDPLYLTTAIPFVNGVAASRARARARRRPTCSRGMPAPAGGRSAS